jgi:hypothetical protein
MTRYILKNKGLAAGLLLSVAMFASCGESYDVIPVRNVNTYRYFLFDSVVNGYYTPNGSASQRDTSEQFLIETPLVMYYDAIHNWVAVDTDTLRPKSDSLNGDFFGTGKIPFDSATRIAWTPDSITITRWATGANLREKSETIKGYKKNN